jgi:serine phosphatase RsbU (regulator of sigma subunit)
MTPHRVLGHVDHRLAEDLTPGWFVTAFLGYLSSDGELEWSSGGHGPILVRPSAEAALLELETPLPLLGVGVDPARFPTPAPLHLEPTGSVVSISDGVFEAPDASDEMFGPANLAAVLDANRSRPACEVVAAIRQAVDRWSPRPDPRDDQTILVARRV